jgi:hypothetical protein
LQSRHSHLTIATISAPAAITVSARSTIAGACSAPAGQPDGRPRLRGIDGVCTRPPRRLWE